MGPDTAGCKDDCAFCFSENFCTRCYPGHFLFRGKCKNSCPNGLTPNAALGECTGEALSLLFVINIQYIWNELFHNVKKLQHLVRCPCVSDCHVGCEVCVRSNVCVRCRADLYFLHGQCHLACPSGFEADVQLMQCNPQGERHSPFLVPTRTSHTMHNVHRNSFVFNL